MKVRAQVAMVMNLDKCIGCHTCSVTCKNVWTSRQGMEYAWFNNVETKPGIGYPKEWENQERWHGGWERKKNGKIEPKQGARWQILAKIFANPHLPRSTIITSHLPSTTTPPDTRRNDRLLPTARPLPLITGERQGQDRTGVRIGRTILGGEFDKRSKDYNVEGIQKDI